MKAVTVKFVEVQGEEMWGHKIRLSLGAWFFVTERSPGRSFFSLGCIGLEAKLWKGEQFHEQKWDKSGGQIARDFSVGASVTHF